LFPLKIDCSVPNLPPGLEESIGSVLNKKEKNRRVAEEETTPIHSIATTTVVLTHPLSDTAFENHSGI